METVTTYDITKEMLKCSRDPHHDKHPFNSYAAFVIDKKRHFFNSKGYKNELTPSQDKEEFNTLQEQLESSPVGTIVETRRRIECKFNHEQRSIYLKTVYGWKKSLMNR
jgi:hypothetical protein